MKPESASGPAIALRVQRGDREAFGALVERFHDFVHAVALAHTRNPDTADDVTQETFLRALQSIERLRDPSRVDRWLAVIARNTARTLQRRSHAAQSLESSEAHRVASDMPDAARMELRGLVRNAMDRLNAKQREVLYLHYFAGMTTEEIAQSLSISRHAAKKRLERSRTALGERLVLDLDVVQEPEVSRKKRVRRVITMAAGGALPQASRVGLVQAIQGAIGFVVAKPVWVGAFAGVVAIGAIGWLQNADSSPPPPPSELRVAADADPNDRSDEDRPTAETEPADLEPADSPGPAQAPVEPVDAPPPRVRELPGLTAELASVLDEPVSIEFKGAHIGNILEFVSDYAGLNIALDWGAIEPAVKPPENLSDRTAFTHVPPRIVPPGGYVTDGQVPPFAYADVPASEILFHVLKSLGLSYVTQPGYVWISTPEKLDSVPDVPEHRLEKAYETADKLDTPVTIDFEGGHLSDVLSSLLLSAKAGAVVDWQVVRPPNRRVWVRAGELSGFPSPKASEEYDVEGYVPFIKVDGSHLDETLLALLNPLGMDFVPMYDFIWVSSTKRIELEPPALTEPVGTSRQVGAALNSQEISLEFEDECLRCILDVVTEQLQTDIAVEYASGIDASELTVPHIKLSDVPMRSVLYALLRPFDLDYEVQANTIVVVRRGQL